MATDTPLVINIDTGIIAFRTEENALQCNCRPISKRHAQMVESGELELKALLAAIKKHMMSAEDFDYDKYADERRKLNVRHTALHADDRETVKDADASEYVSDAEVEDAKQTTDDAVDAAAREVESAAPKARSRQKKAQAAQVEKSDLENAELALGQ